MVVAVDLLPVEGFVDDEHTNVRDSAGVHEVLVVGGEPERNDFEPEDLCHAYDDHEGDIQKELQDYVDGDVSVGNLPCGGRLGLGLGLEVEGVDEDEGHEKCEFDVDLPCGEQLGEFVRDEDSSPAGRLGFIVVELLVALVLFLGLSSSFFEVQKVKLSHYLFVDPLQNSKHVCDEHGVYHDVEIPLQFRRALGKHDTCASLELVEKEHLS